MPRSVRDPMQVAARALARRDLSAAALTRALLSAGVDAERAGDAVATLVAGGVVDDARLAERRAGLLAERGFGNAAIDARLEADGIGREERDAALAALVPESERARGLARASAGGDPARLAALLARRGFEADAVEAAVAAVDARPAAELG